MDSGDRVTIPPRQLYRLFILKKYRDQDVGIYPEVQS